MKTFLFNTMDFAQSWSADILLEHLDRDMQVLVLPMMANDGWSADVLAYRDELAESEDLREPFLRCGIPASHIRILDPYDHDGDILRRHIRRSDIVCLVSDNAGYAMNVITDMGIAEALSDHPGIIFGIGECVRILARAYISPADRLEYPGLSRYLGINVYPGYEGSAEDLRNVTAWLEQNETAMILLERESGVLITEEQIEVIGQAYIAQEEDLDRLYAMYTDELRF